MSSLTDRIAVILQTTATSDALAEVIDDAQDELEASREACAEAQARVLDPFSTSAVVTKAKRDLEDQTTAAARLEAALERLSGQLEIARRREKEAGRQRRYDEAKAEQEVAIKEFMEIYPEAAVKIATVLARLKAVDDKAAKVNNDRPAGAAGLQFIERTILTLEGLSFSSFVKLPVLPGADVPEHLKVDPYQINIWPMSRGF